MTSVWRQRPAPPASSESCPSGRPPGPIAADQSSLQPGCSPCKRASSAPMSSTSPERPASMWCLARSRFLPAAHWLAPILRSPRLHGRACAPTGRGARVTLSLGNGEPALLIDESYNANPASMRAAIALLGQAEIGRADGASRCSATCSELGTAGVDLHADCKTDPRAWDRPGLLLRPLMRALWEALPSERRGGYAEGAAHWRPM